MREATIVAGSMVKLSNRRVISARLSDGTIGIQWKRLGVDGESKVHRTIVTLSEEAAKATVRVLIEAIEWKQSS